ncbi:hypothetical protein V7U50_21405, partial [Segatella copri]
QSCWQISSKVILLPIRYVICIFINKQVDIYSLAKLQLYIIPLKAKGFIKNFTKREYVIIPQTMDNGRTTKKHQSGIL